MRIKHLRSTLKFFVKIAVVERIRSFLLFFFGKRACREGWEKRLLLVNLETVGDIAMMTGVLQHYRRDLPGKEIHLLLNSRVGFDEVSLGGFVHRVMHVDYRAFSLNPLYGLRLINQLRFVGFATVVNHDPSAAEIIGKLIAVQVEARHVIGYEGIGVQWQRPFDANMAMNLAYARTKIFPKYTKLIPSIDKGADLAKRLPLFLRHYAAIARGVTTTSHEDITPALAPTPAALGTVRKVLAVQGVQEGSYCALTLGAGTPHREWGAEKFAEVLSALRPERVPVVVIGLPKEKRLAERFRKAYGSDMLDLTGKTTLPEAVAVIALSLFSLSNDTGSTHLAVALQKPSLTVLGLGHFGMLSLYGYPDINRWVWNERSCICDNWRCILEVGGDEPAPCIREIPVGRVVEETRTLIRYLRKTPRYPREPFTLEFNPALQ